MGGISIYSCNLIKISVVFICVIITIFGVVYSYFNYQQYPPCVVRFHVVANSDSVEDQALKMRVKDIVIDAMRHKLENTSK